jgi:beta-mannosidase
MRRPVPDPAVRRANEPVATRTLLHDGWVLDLTGNGDRLPPDCPVTVPATVPGCVHLDLLAAGLIDDPYRDRNELALQWVGESAWTYLLGFDADDDVRRADLVFEGVDGFATISLNGALLGRAENQHRIHRFDVSERLERFGNELVVAFDAPTMHAAALRDRTGDLPNPFGTPYNFVRKMACNFGWDWGPQLTTSGLWRPVALERWDIVRIRAVRPTVRLATEAPTADETGRLDVVVDLVVDADDDARSGSAPVVRAAVTSPEGEVVGTSEPTPVSGTSVELAIDVRGIARWWPAGYGPQPLYQLAVEVAGDDRCHDRAVTTVGFRVVRLDTSALVDGRAFALHVNGERIWVRGVNWIPADCFPSRNSGERVATLLGDALEANANLIRVWGGGVYESDAFYDECDRRGLLVWQDFPFACAAYPEALLGDEVAAEATENVTRLMPHASLALWCGNNECLQGWAEWGWPDVVGDRPWGASFYRRLLPDIVGALDPTRPYLDGTPTALDPALPPNGPDHGTVHLWDVWNQFDYEHYRTHRPRFVAEFGFQAPPTFSTIAAAVSTRPLTIDSPEVQHHQKATDGESKLRRSLDHHFGDVDDFDDWLYLTQVNQARAIELGVGHFRALHERCSGVVWWQLDDCWPSISWAVVDRAGRRKPGWYTMRRSFAERLLVLHPHDSDGTLDLVLVNDSTEPWEASTVVERVSPAGDVDRAADLTATVAPRRSERLAVPTGGVDGLVVATSRAQRAVHAPPSVDSRLPRPQWELAVGFGPSSVSVSVTATTVVRDLCLFADRVDPGAAVDEQVVTLLPGETHTFTVSTSRAPDRPAWIEQLRDGGLVLRAIGDGRTG